MANRPQDALTDFELELVAGLDPVLQPFALRHRERVLARGVPFNFTSGLRSRSQQSDLFSEKPGIAVAPGKSKHEIGFAYDATGPRTSEEWAVFGEEAEALGLEWGGRYRPKPELWHVEAPDSRASLAAYRAFKIAGLLGTLGVGSWLLVKRS